jgi:hypothetical protein
MSVKYSHHHDAANRDNDDWSHKVNQHVTEATVSVRGHLRVDLIDVLVEDQRYDRYYDRLGTNKERAAWPAKSTRYSQGCQKHLKPRLYEALTGSIATPL